MLHISFLLITKKLVIAPVINLFIMWHVACALIGLSLKTMCTNRQHLTTLSSKSVARKFLYDISNFYLEQLFFVSREICW